MSQDGESVTTASSSYTIQYATIPVATSPAADPRMEEVAPAKKPAPPANAKDSRSVAQTKTVRRMYRRKYQRHRLSHVDQLSKKSRDLSRQKQQVVTTENVAPGAAAGTDAAASAYNSYYSFLQAQVSSIS